LSNNVKGVDNVFVYIGAVHEGGEGWKGINLNSQQSSTNQNQINKN